MHLTLKDKVFIAALTAGWVGLALLARLVFPDGFAIVAAGSAMLIVMVTMFEVYRRLLGALKTYHEEPTVNYRQVESLFSLFASLPIDHPLPPLRGAAVSPDFASTLVRLILESRPSTILELGSGSSTIVAAYALRKNGRGRIVSLEQDAGYARVSARQVAERGLSDVASVVHAPLRGVALNGTSWNWYDPAPIGTLSEIDLLIVDGPLQQGQHERMLRYPALPVLSRRLGPRAAILLDDGQRDDERHVVERWLKEFPEFERQVVASEKGTVILRKKV